MSMSRTLRHAVGRLLIGVVLTAQLAVSAHTCPMAVAASAASMAGAEQAMPPGCDQMTTDMDMAGSNLCAAHCHQGDQSADTAAAPAVPAAIPALLYALPLEPARLRGTAWPAATRDTALAMAPEPPHAILHCVFRL